MKLVLFQQSDADPQLPGLLTDRGVVDISAVVRSNHTPQLVMEGIIDDFEELRPTLEKLVGTATALPLPSVRLRAPLPRPHKILCALANYWEHAQRAPRPLNMFMKNPDAIVDRTTRFSCLPIPILGSSCTRPSSPWSSKVHQR